MKKTLVILLVVAGVLLAACGGSGGGQTLKIVSSLPLTGSSLTQTDTIVKSIQLKLKQIGNKVCGGKYSIVYESKDDASAALGKWDPAVETENANKAAADKSVIAYIGTFNSGAAALSIPILNKAEVVMVSPANTNPGLTKPGKGDAAKGEPEVYYPNGKRNYARVVAADTPKRRRTCSRVTELPRDPRRPRSAARVASIGFRK
jgi:branched-chain amino acid transport system substrate-binding protein